jgi:hypothetical protein
MCINCLDCTKFLNKKCDQSKEYQQEMLHRSIHQQGIVAWIYRGRRRIKVMLYMDTREIVIERERKSCMSLVG